MHRKKINLFHEIKAPVLDFHLLYRLKQQLLVKHRAFMSKFLVKIKSTLSSYPILLYRIKHPALISHSLV